MAYNISYLILIEYIFIFAFQVIAFSTLCYSMIKKVSSDKLSAAFIIYLSIILVESFSTILQSAYMIVHWKADVGYEPFWVFSLTFPCFILVPALSAAVFFLLLHRIFAVYWMNAKNASNILFAVSVIVISGVILSNAAYIIMKASEVLPSLGTSKCWTMSCTMGNGNILYLSYKAFFGVLSAIAGCVFIYVLGNTPTGNEFARRANNLTLVTISMELFLNFIPPFVDVFFQIFFDIKINATLGQYSHTLCALDSMIVGIIYSRYFLKSSHRVVSISPTQMSRASK